MASVEAAVDHDMQVADTADRPEDDTVELQAAAAHIEEVVGNSAEAEDHDNVVEVVPYVSERHY